MTTWNRPAATARDAVVRRSAASRGAFALGFALLGGCALAVGDIADKPYTAAFRTDIQDTATLTADEQSRLSRVQVYDTATGLSYTSFGNLTGLSCRETTRWVPPLSDMNGTTPELAAMTQLEVKTLKAGGDAIPAPTCKHRSTIDGGNNCFASWRCTGEVIRVYQ
jgi:hypothetical protein